MHLSFVGRPVLWSCDHQLTFYAPAGLGHMTTTSAPTARWTSRNRSAGKESYARLLPQSAPKAFLTRYDIHMPDLSVLSMYTCAVPPPPKCAKCGQVPVGDYHENRNHALCRPCYQQLHEGGEAGAESLRGMRKVRDCTAIHKHDFPGTAPKTIVSQPGRTQLRDNECQIAL